MSKWPKEQIPPSDWLYKRVPKAHYSDDVLNSAATFRNTPTKQDGMSVDWSRHSTPEQTLRRAVQKPVATYGVIKLQVAKVAKIPGQRIEHTPRDDNQSHADVFGDKDDPEVKLKFLRCSEWCIRIGEVAQ